MVNRSQSVAFWTLYYSWVAKIPGFQLDTSRVVIWTQMVTTREVRRLQREEVEQSDKCADSRANKMLFVGICAFGTIIKKKINQSSCTCCKCAFNFMLVDLFGPFLCLSGSFSCFPRSLSCLAICLNGGLITGGCFLSGHKCPQHDYSLVHVVRGHTRTDLHRYLRLHLLPQFHISHCGP